MKMSLSFAAQGCILFVTAALLAVGHAETIVVGGSENWRFGFNYTGWALEQGPFRINDTLVFKYNPPSATTAPQNVYLLPNLWSYMTCDLRKAKLVADAKQGGGNGFKFVMNQWRPYYFASGVGNGYNCQVGLMKFFAVPWPL